MLLCFESTPTPLFFFTVFDRQSYHSARFDSLNIDLDQDLDLGLDLDQEVCIGKGKTDGVDLDLNDKMNVMQMNFFLLRARSRDLGLDIRNRC